MLLGMGAVGAFLVVDVGAVAYANKLVGAGNALTPRAFIEGFRAVFGLPPGFRRNHAKGVMVTGYFDSNGAGVRTPIRWAFVPLQASQPARLGTQNALFDALVRQMRNRTLRWRLVLTVGRPGDPVTDATLPWPSDRLTIDAGVLTLTNIET